MRKSLTREERIRSGSEIRALFGSSRRVDGGAVKLLYRDNGRAVNRIAIIAGRGCKSAVVRNRERRITREAYRDLKIDLTPGKDMLVVVNRCGQSYHERRQSLQRLFQRARLYDRIA